MDFASVNWTVKSNDTPLNKIERLFIHGPLQTKKADPLYFTHIQCKLTVTSKVN